MRKKIKFIFIFWVISLKIIELFSNLITVLTPIKYFEIMTNQELSKYQTLVWDFVFLCVLVWAIYKILSDYLDIDLEINLNKNNFNINLLLIIILSLSLLLQGFLLQERPIQEPVLKVDSFFSNEKEIFGWYSIDWGKTYYSNDFQVSSSMFIDCLVFRSYEHHFGDQPEYYLESINKAKEKSFKIGILLFHPYDGLYQDFWGLKNEQGSFSDFLNKTWIDNEYKNRMMKISELVNEYDVDYLIFDGMNLEESNNVKNFPYFVNITESMVGKKYIMMADYPPEDIEIYRNQYIANWDWYNAPEQVRNIGSSQNNIPFCDTNGVFIWLYNNMDVEHGVLSNLYNKLESVERIQIYALREGQIHWVNTTKNNILDHPELVKKLAELNKNFKQTLKEYENNISTSSIYLDFRKSNYINPFLDFRNGSTSEYATAGLGHSYLKIETSPTFQEILHLRYAGNKNLSKNGWFARKINLSKPIYIKTNTYLKLLLNTSKTFDKSGWTRIRFNIQDSNSRNYTLGIKFTEGKGDYSYISNNKGEYIIGNSSEWRLHQINLHDLFYNSFFVYPEKINGYTIDIGSNAYYEYSVYFKLLQISPNIIEIGNEPVHNFIVSKNQDININFSGIEFKDFNILYNSHPNSKTQYYIPKMFFIKEINEYYWEFSNNLNIKNIELSEINENYYIVERDRQFHLIITINHSIYLFYIAIISLIILIFINKQRILM